ncbi:periplasmic protein [Xenorhabdus mauleonii]|uniref:Lysophospholipase L1 n=1 Tax=Xenorhabdus mauleonii TaxID=351675 RepID=A0A1I3KBK0_9GAMM|nr:SGNH/GDSL hydrolase family protein [Xenorhabdus mauleonii]PHM45000.1 periplasmic protein [Xenorhabdus mauleonii]SFI69843.1 Lysophospholipase L1 [Xenorhabdus mauleonii]
MQPFSILRGFYRIMGAGLVIALSVSLLSCHGKKTKPSSERQVTQTQRQQQLTNFGDPNFALLADKLRHRDTRQIHFVQLGDSHTAADFFTGKLRNLLQGRYGDAGPGFIPPMNIPGQRHDIMKFAEDKTGWWLSSSRKDNRADYPLGGFIATPESANSKIQLYSPSAHGKYWVSALYQSHEATTIKAQSASTQVWPLPATNSEWRFSPEQSVRFPVTIFLQERFPQERLPQESQLKIGGWLIKRQSPGIMLSTLGINGATINMLDKWQPQWVDTLAQLKPDMVILAYGTNEAFNESLDLATYQKELTAKVQNIRKAIPEAVILLIGPNDSLKNKATGNCSEQQSTLLSDVIQVQQDVAKKQHTLFWDWRAFMGGPCSIKGWEQQNLARPDYIHLSAAGYERSAEALYKQFTGLVEKWD